MPIDKIANDGSSNFPKVSSAPVYVQSVNITGNLNELVIPVGFPDLPSTQAYPTLVNNPLYPKLGQFPDGTLLSDYITSHGGSIPEDVWYEPAFNHYFNTESGGLYNVNFHFIKRANGTRYLTTHNYSYFVGLNNNSDSSVIYNQLSAILNEVAQNMYADNPNVFNNINLLHFTFEGISKCEFYNCQAGGTVNFNMTLTASNGQVLYQGKPVSIQLNANLIPHEYMHIIGAVSGSPNGFKGFPDRGVESYLTIDNHNNMLWTYDMMYHDAALAPLHSLYGFPPILSHDLIFLGWIKPNEVQVIDQSNYSSFSDIKLSDINYPLTTQQLADGYKRIVKVMIHENYSGNLSEYYLIEYHAASEFDKAFENYAEYPLTGYNKGILIWHIKEKVNMINLFYDNQIELVAAVPYNGWYGNPIPNDNYPRNYTRPAGFNGIYNGDFNYLDDNLMNSSNQFYYLPDGGEHIWETTVINDPNNTYHWDPTGQRHFMRLQSMSSDFFSDASIKVHITNQITDASIPSTQDWGALVGGIPVAEKTHIAITNITRQNGYMTVRVNYNYYVANTTLSGNLTFYGNLTVASGVTLTIQPGAILNFANGSSLNINGTLSAIGTSTSPITINNDSIVFNGSGESGSLLNYANINNGAWIQCLNAANATIENSKLSYCTNGIYVYNSSPAIEYNQIIEPQQNGIYGQPSGSLTVLNNTITKTSASGGYYPPCLY